MESITNFINKIFLFDKEPLKIGLSQFKEAPVQKKVEPSIKNKNVKLSDLMRKNNELSESTSTEV